MLEKHTYYKELCKAVQYQPNKVTDRLIKRLTKDSHFKAMKKNGSLNLMIYEMNNDVNKQVSIDMLITLTHYRYKSLNKLSISDYIECVKLHHSKTALGSLQKCLMNYQKSNDKTIIIT